jgi:LemA protein
MIKAILVIFFVFSFHNCGYNTIQELDEQVNADTAEVLNQYKRRADLIPQLVKVVEGYADFERDVLTEVTKARSSVGSLQLTPEMLKDPENLQKFQAAQSSLGGALQRLLVVSEKYPDLKANEGFRDLQSQLEGTENRIAVARGRYIKSIQAYNTYIRKFPGVVWARIFDYQVKVSLTTDNPDSIQKVDSDAISPPNIDFKKKESKNP